MPLHLKFELKERDMKILKNLENDLYISADSYDDCICYSSDVLLAKKFDSRHSASKYIKEARKTYGIPKVQLIDVI